MMLPGGFSESEAVKEQSPLGSFEFMRYLVTKRIQRHDDVPTYEGGCFHVR